MEKLIEEIRREHLDALRAVDLDCCSNMTAV